MQVSKGTAGVWNGTGVRLFRVQEVQERGPTLSSPRGAVDAVGSNIVRRMGGLGFGSGSGANSGSGNGNVGQGEQELQRRNTGGVAREQQGATGRGRETRSAVI